MVGDLAYLRQVSATPQALEATKIVPTDEHE
jgi:hypothetical protein